jgi:ABC-type multidrug transport system permease subunit
MLSDGSYSLGMAVSVPVTLTLGTGGQNPTNTTSAAGNLSGTITQNMSQVNGTVTHITTNNSSAHQENTSSGPLYLTYTIVAIAIILLIVGLTRPRKPNRRRGGNNRDL